MKKSEATRLNILQKAFELIYVKGYQTTSVDDIIATTGLTKGAFYYHFKSKDEMGMAIIGEILKPALTGSFLDALTRRENPLESVYELMEELLLENEFLKPEFGCPASNFTQEMAPWNTEFTRVLQELTGEWAGQMAAILEKGKQKGHVRTDIDSDAVAVFVMSGYWGVRNFGKLETDLLVYQTYLKALKSYLQTLG